jgi:two-component system, NtrC family, response regulator AtoC
MADRDHKDAKSEAASRAHAAPDHVSVKVGTSLAEAEKRLIQATLLRFKSRKKVAALLGISLKTLYNKMKQYSLSDRVDA